MNKLKICISYQHGPLNLSYCCQITLFCYKQTLYDKYAKWLIIDKNYKKMKLTTVKGSKQTKPKPISNVFKLKQKIQTAANTNGTSDKQNMNINSNISNNYELPLSSQHLKKSKDLYYYKTKNQRCNSQSNYLNTSKLGKSNITKNNLNFQKLKINPLDHHHEHRKKHQFQQFYPITKSKSNKIISTEKIKSCYQSFICKFIHQQYFNIDNFILGKKLGKGRFGNVYVAQQKQTKFLFALKIINKKQLKQAQMEKQLISQIKLQSFMKHPNILQLYGFFDDLNHIYLILELAQLSLFKNLRKSSSYPQKQVAYYTKQMLQGLKYMHNQSIIHRDLKPQNIMMIFNVLKLADFGWSVYSPLQYSFLLFSKRQTFCGTLDYVPPEIVIGDYYDQRVDVWSLGILIFQLTFGYPPFEGCNTEQQTFQRIVNAEFDIPHHVSDELRKIIKYVLIRNPKNRLNLKQIQQSPWLKLHEKQGRSISSEIWNYWQNQRTT